VPNPTAAKLYCRWPQHLLFLCLGKLPSTEPPPPQPTPAPASIGKGKQPPKGKQLPQETAHPPAPRPVWPPYPAQVRAAALRTLATALSNEALMGELRNKWLWGVLRECIATAASAEVLAAAATLLRRIGLMQVRT
jgi:hypothetical protein